jgi:hypothetical protein
VNAQTTFGNRFEMGDLEMSNSRAWTAPAIVASLLGIGGLGYAHVQFEGILWVFHVAVASIWRIFAANLAGPLLHAAALLVPVALTALVIAGVISEKRPTRQ